MKFILERRLSYDNKSHEWPQILAICIASMSSFTSGLLHSWTSPSIPILISNASQIEPITLEEASYFTVIPPIAGILLGPIFAIVVDVIGRRNTIMFIAVPQIISFLLIALAEDTTTFYVSRFFTGVGEAVHYNAVPMYVGEIAIPKVRGLGGTFICINFAFGQFMINILGAYFDIRTTAYICVAVPVLQILLTGLLPESPYFLLMKDKIEEARTSLKTLRWKENVDEELTSLTKDVQRQCSESGTFKDLFTNSTNRKALLISLGLRSAQQLSGITAFALYSQYMFNQSGSNLSASTSAIIYSGALVLFLSIFSFVVDKFGRKLLMIFSSFGCGVVIAIEAVYFYIYQKTDLDISQLNWVPLTGMVLFIFICSSGLVILPTLMLGELFSTSIKGKALYINSTFYSLCILSVTKIFQSLSDNYGMYVPFCLFSICCFVGVAFSYYCVPETKGKTLEEIQKSLRGCHNEPKDCRKQSLNKA